MAICIHCGEEFEKESIFLDNICDPCINEEAEYDGEDEDFEDEDDCEE